MMFGKKEPEVPLQDGPQLDFSRLVYEWEAHDVRWRVLVWGAGGRTCNLHLQWFAPDVNEWRDLPDGGWSRGSNLVPVENVERAVREFVSVVDERAAGIKECLEADNMMYAAFDRLNGRETT